MILEYFKENPYIPDPNFQTKMAACFDLAAYIPKNEKVKIFEDFNKQAINTSPTVIYPFEDNVQPVGYILPFELKVIQVNSSLPPAMS